MTMRVMTILEQLDSSATTLLLHMNIANFVRMPLHILRENSIIETN